MIIFLFFLFSIAKSLPCPKIIQLPQYDVDYLMEKLQVDQKFSQPFARTLVEEFENFFSLAAAGEVGSPSLLIDKVWHSYILNTKIYAAACRKYSVNQKFIHHVPFWSKENRVGESLFARVQECFGKNVNESVWKTPDLCTPCQNCVVPPTTSCGAWCVIAE